MFCDRTSHPGPRTGRGSFDLSGEPSDSLIDKAGRIGFRAFLESCAGLIAEKAGPENVRSVYLFGSFALGEGSVAVDEGRQVFLSDIDLVLVLSEIDEHRRLLAVRRELGEACEQLMPEADFVGRIDVGVVHESELGSFSRSPGVFDMRSAGVVLYGDDSVLRDLPLFDPSRIEPIESLILLENRIASLLGAFPKGEVRERSRFDYQIAKTYTDILTSSLCLAGAYIPGYEKRLDVMRSIEAGGPLDRLVPKGIREKIERWTLFKLEPSGKAHGANDHRGLWDEAATDLSDAWRRCETYRCGGPGEGPGEKGPAELLDSRERRASRANLLGWKNLLATMPVGRRIRLIAGMGGRMPGRSPLRVVREEGVLLISHASRFGTEGDVKRPPGSFPHGGGAWQDAAGELSGIWNEIVFSRKGS